MLTKASIHEWADEVRRHLPLSRPQAFGLALWSLGVAVSGGCGQSTVSDQLARLLGHKPNTVRQRLREFCYEASAKRGARRRAVDVQGCFAALLGWVRRLWRGTRLALVLDATGLKQDFVVLSVSVAFRGGAIPVAWRALRGATPAAWQPHWQDLLERVRGALPGDWVVLVPTDRGLYAPWLFAAIVQAGFHPLMRINAGGFFRPEGEEDYRPLSAFAPGPGAAYRGRGVAFKEHPVACTLLVRWDEGQAEPWRLLTDLAPADAEAGWYALRAWVEQGYKDLKRGGFQWQGTRMTDPERVTRFWLVLAVATLWLLAVGGAGEEADPPARPRRLSVFRQGWNRVRAWLLHGAAPRPAMRLVPEPWPEAGARTGPPSPKRKLLLNPQKTYP